MKAKEETQNDGEYGFSSSRHGKVKLLLVEENAEELLYYCSILQRQGYDVRPLSSYREAALRIEREAFDLVIMRQGESNFQGRSILSRTIEKSRNVPVLVLSHRVESGNSLHGPQMELPDYSESPLVPSEVAEQVAAYLRFTSRAA